ncbi:MAG: thiamine diphosphokinase [Mycoplasmataceae bacterium]|nr:thiamine diphosphokinase [Mycoplasmataceae bacterium]
MSKCLITTKNINHDKFNHEDYDCFIGIELGAKFLFENLAITNKHYISDFDSIDLKTKKLLKEQDNYHELPKSRDLTDTEEAIKYGLNLGYKNIDLYVDEDRGRKDHLISIYYLANKYQLNVFGNKFKITPLPKNKTTTIYNKYKYVSIFVNQKTKVSSNGLVYELKNESFTILSGTKLISNEINGDSANICVNKNAIIIQAND